MLASFLWRLLLPKSRSRLSPKLGLLEVQEGLLGERDMEFSRIGGPFHDASVSPERSSDREAFLAVGVFSVFILVRV